MPDERRQARVALPEKGAVCFHLLLAQHSHRGSGQAEFDERIFVQDHPLAFGRAHAAEESWAAALRSTLRRGWTKVSI
jgi:hypothetical protein